MNEYIEHTNLKPFATRQDIHELCKQAIEHNFRSVVVAPTYVELANELLYGTPPIVVTVGSFPLGYTGSAATRITEAKEVEPFTDEIDIVMNMCKFKNGDYLSTMLDLAGVVKSVNMAVKVIVEVAHLSDNIQLAIAYDIVRDSGAPWIKTSTGFAEDNLIWKTQAVRLWKSFGDLKIKAAGGIRNLETAKLFLKDGADLLGTSHGVAIMEEHNAN